MDPLSVGVGLVVFGGAIISGIAGIAALFKKANPTTQAKGEVHQLFEEAQETIDQASRDYLKRL